jgi:hypothetical protein
MKKKVRLFILPLIFLAFISPLPAEDTLQPIPEDAANAEPDYNDTEFGAAVTLSHTITSTTGIAMSPLLGMGVLGAWKYYKSDGEYRNNLPWYSKPWVWGICFGIFLILKSKDTLGVWIPEVAKKPITVLDDLADKASAVIVAIAVIPSTVLDDFETLVPQTSTEAPVAMAPFILPVLVIAVSILIFGVVWIAFNALSSIKILSPSSVVNSIISVFKGLVIAVFAGLAVLNPWVGLAISLVVILVCTLIFGWAFRWNVFGTLFVKDFFTGAHNDPLKTGEDLKGFSTANFPGLKPRTYGRVTREGNELIFRWKPWLIMPARKSRIDLENTDTSCRKGIFFPSVTLRDSGTDRHRSIIDFRLRYRSHGEEIQSLLALDSMSPGLVLSGVRSAWLWLKEQVQRGGAEFARVIQ